MVCKVCRVHMFNFVYVCHYSSLQLPSSSAMEGEIGPFRRETGIEFRNGEVNSVTMGLLIYC